MQLKNLWFFFFGFIYILGAIVFQIDALFTPDAFSVPKAILALPFSQDVNSSNEDKRIVPVKEKKILKKRIKKKLLRTPLRRFAVFLWKCWYWLLYYFSIRGAVRGTLMRKHFLPRTLYIYIYNDPYILYIYGGEGKRITKKGHQGLRVEALFLFFLLITNLYF